MIIRKAELADAGQLADLIAHVEASSNYMLWEAGERELSAERQESMIRRLNESWNSTILLAENEDGDLAGYLFAIGGEAKRNQHAAYLVIGIGSGYRGQGVGAQLFEELTRWAEETGLRRLELTVVTKNAAGVSLYKKMGFAIEGTKRDSLLICGEFADEYYMSKLIEPPGQ